MFNLIELLTVIIGLLLALVFIDGIRRSFRKRKSQLKVDLVTAGELENLQEIDQENLSDLIIEDEVINNLDDFEEDNVDTKPHSLIIFNLCSEDLDAFSYDILSKKLSAYKLSFEENGFFVFKDTSNQTLFNLINAKKPGNFLLERKSSDIALVLDPSKSNNVIESFDLMHSVALFLCDAFSCTLLDMNRNLLTKQMLEHMRNESQEFQRQHLANVS